MGSRYDVRVVTIKVTPRAKFTVDTASVSRMCPEYASAIGQVGACGGGYASDFEQTRQKNNNTSNTLEIIKISTRVDEVFRLGPVNVTALRLTGNDKCKLLEGSNCLTFTIEGAPLPFTPANHISYYMG